MRLLKVLSGQNPREIAIDVLGPREPNEYIEDVLDRALAQNTLAPKDRGLCQELVYGITRNQTALDWLIARKTGSREQKPALRNLLRLGLYQVFWTDRIPGHAAVNETVELAKRRGFGSQAGFVNAILRGYLRELAQTRDALDSLKKSEPWIGYSQPEWLVKRWTQRWGLENTLRLLEWNNTSPETFARVNTLKTDATRLIEQWRQENVEYDFVRKDWFDENLVFNLKKHPPLHRLNSFTQGHFYIQDPSTLLAVHDLDPQPGMAVLDLCAAPGGKLTFIAQAMGDNGRIAGWEVSEQRLSLVLQNCQRLGISIAELALNPDLAASPPQKLKSEHSEKFDRVLIDAPCSNTGVMRRRVDLRWRVKPEEIQRLRSAQLGLLSQGARLLKPSGTLVYSTCSMEPEENCEVVREFLSGHPALRLERERTLLPFTEGTDGAFTAKMVKA